jgi:hypothetical protein
MKSTAVISWGAYPDILFLVYKGLVCSVLDYDDPPGLPDVQSIACFTGQLINP